MQPNGHDGHSRAVPTAQRARSDAVDARVRLVSIVCSWAAALLAIVGLAGWVFGIPALTYLHVGLAAMKVDTALMLLLLALSRLIPGRMAAWFAVPAAAIAGATVLEYLTRHNFHIDQLLFADPGGGAHPGRSSLAVALCALLLAITALPAVTRRRSLCETLSLAVFAGAFLAALGSLYGVHYLHAVAPYAAVAVLTAAALMLLSLAGLASVDHGLAMWVVAGSKPGSTLMRVVTPVSFVVLPAIGYCCVVAERHGWMTGNALVSLNVLLCLTVLIAAGWVAGVRLDRFDSRRKKALADLSALAEDLERQVVERSSQLQSGRDELVVLADRQRIAADLHDIVVQRLFATGMMLNSVDPASVEASIGQRIDDAIEAMDAAIMDLRASIFELSHSPTQRNDLLTSLDALCIDASRALGFRPDLTVDDPDDDAADIYAEILAVTRESLANSARHAAASSAEVVLRCSDGVLSLEITDDGIGMTLAPHSSGTQNMADRARRLGGDCAWLPVEPHGTRVRWRVPVSSGSKLIFEPARVSELVTGPAPDGIHNDGHVLHPSGA